MEEFDDAQVNKSCVTDTGDGWSEVTFLAYSWSVIMIIFHFLVRQLN